jgi:lambda family phage tail tape measure protein
LAIAIAGAGLGEFIKGAMEAGAQAVELAEKFGVTTEAMLEINSAAMASGIGVDKIATAMNKMLVGAEQAAEGNGKLQQALKDVGTSTDYLRTHTADEAFSKQIHALAEMTDKAKAAEIGMQLFGKASRTMDFAEIARNLDENAGSMGKYAEAAEAAKHTQEQFNKFVMELKLTVLEMIEPFQGFIESFLKSKIAIDLVIAALGGLAIITGIIGLYKAWQMAVLAVELAQKGFNAALAIMDALLAPEILIIAGVVAALATLYVAYEMVTGKVGSFSEGMKKLKDDMGDAASAVVDKLTGSLNKNTEAKEKNAKSGGGGSSVLPSGGHDLNPMAGAEQSLKNQYELYKLNNDRALERLNLEIKIAGASSEQQKSELAGFDAQTNYLKERTRLEGEIKKLQVEQRNTVGGNQGGQISILQQQLKDLDSNTEAYRKLNAEKTKADNVAAMGRFYDEEKLKVNKELLDIQTQIDQLTMTSSEKTLNDIQKQIHAEQELALKKRQSQLAVGESISKEDIADINKTIAESYQPVIDKTQALINKSREFNTGWESAFKQYVDDATNAANQGKAMFDSMTNAMNSAIDTFVTTGKFSFGDFARSVIQDLEKIAIKAAAAQVLKASGMGSLFAGAFAEGGVIPAGQFGLVGEAGPELIRGPAQVTSAKDTAASMSGGHTIINNNISAIDSKSVAQMFAENRQMMFGFVEQARKEMPMRTR